MIGGTSRHFTASSNISFRLKTLLIHQEQAGTLMELEILSFQRSNQLFMQHESARSMQIDRAWKIKMENINRRRYKYWRQELWSLKRFKTIEIYQTTHAIRSWKSKFTLSISTARSKKRNWLYRSLRLMRVMRKVITPECLRSLIKI